MLSLLKIRNEQNKRKATSHWLLSSVLGTFSVYLKHTVYNIRELCPIFQCYYVLSCLSHYLRSCHDWRNFPYITSCEIKAMFFTVLIRSRWAAPHNNKWRRRKHTIRLMVHPERHLVISSSIFRSCAYRRHEKTKETAGMCVCVLWLKGCSDQYKDRGPKGKESSPHSNHCLNLQRICRPDRFTPRWC